MFFSTFGGLKRVKLPKKLGAEANRHRGFAFVEFTNESDAKVSISWQYKNMIKYIRMSFSETLKKK